MLQTMHVSRIWIAGCALLAIALSGCPGSKKTRERDSTTVPAPCTKLGAQCELSASTLGVCTETPCPEGKAPPCLKCVSQH
jgi:hypothetical protein